MTELTITPFKWTIAVSPIVVLLFLMLRCHWSAPLLAGIGYGPRDMNVNHAFLSYYALTAAGAIGCIVYAGTVFFG